MKKCNLLLELMIVLSVQSFAQYNTLWIPDTLTGKKTFDLTIKDTFSQIIFEQQTITGGIHGKFWGLTLFIYKSDTVRMNVKNSLNDSTTLHWHGMHLPAVMDGGLHQVIPPRTTWQPFWKMANNAGTYGYHLHLHEMTMEQITKGISGLIIVRGPIESSVKLPRKYGLDDIPLVLGALDFNMVRINIIAQTAAPITTIPTALTTNVLLNAATANTTRKLMLSDSAGVRVPVIMGPNSFIVNRKLFNIILPINACM